MKPKTLAELFPYSRPDPVNGWTETELVACRKGDPAKLAIAARLRKETTLSIKAIASLVHLGASKGANTNLPKWMRARANENSEGGAPGI